MLKNAYPLTWSIKLIHLSQFLQAVQLPKNSVSNNVPLTLIAFGQGFQRDPNRTLISAS